MNAVPRPEHPRPDRMRAQWKNLNGCWDFMLFPIGQEEAERSFAENRIRYERKIMVPFSWASPLSEVGENVAGVGWYRCEAEFDTTQRVFLCLGGIDHRADIYINGVHAAFHQGGYTPMECDVTPFWRAGSNQIEVRAEDFRYETQLYGKQGYGDIQGIWQTVWLEERPESYLQRFRIDAFCNGEICIYAEAQARNGATLSACFADRMASAVIQDGRVELRFILPNPRLWSPEDPFLYDGRLLLEDGESYDEVGTYFGVREIGTMRVKDRDLRWITLNGKPVYLNGTLDQAFHPQGHFTYPSDQALQDEVWRAKRLGLNLMRIHIKAEEPRKLYWMDKLGMLVMADIPCFWGPPVEEARSNYESAWPEIIWRDRNHPSIIAWVMFNETWGLLTGKGQNKVYEEDTQHWVEDVYRRAKAMDPTRLVEDNSPCRYDHTQTDLNSWHFYLNGYDTVRNHIREVVQKSYPGSAFNCVGGYRQSDAPLMNSECGLVWGVDESAGDSDLAWQYRYMLNEFRLHDKLCGFVFTEYRDVVNEFNGYYRIDDVDKDFGYQDFCRGMTLRDLHTPDFLAVDCPPCATYGAGDQVEVPLTLSSFSEQHQRRGLRVKWELWHDSPWGRVVDGMGERDIPPFGYGTTVLQPLNLTLPAESAVEILSLYLLDQDGTVLSRNFTTFDVRATLWENAVEAVVSQGKVKGFGQVWTAHREEKLCLGGEGIVEYDFHLPQIGRIDRLTLHMELGSKRILKKDLQDSIAQERDLDFMRGYLVDRGAFRNSYWMTDESRLPTQVEVLIDGQSIADLTLHNDWADARGVLSWHYQSNPRLLDEAGSFGEAQAVEIPSRLLPMIQRKGGFVLALRVQGNGLALYGRNSGRYPWGLLLVGEGE